MPNEMPIKTTGELRQFLAKTMIEVKEGSIDIDKARNITKLAGQITESFYAEVKIAKTRVEAGEALTALGDMKIGG